MQVRTIAIAAGAFAVVVLSVGALLWGTANCPSSFECEQVKGLRGNDVETTVHRSLGEGAEALLILPGGPGLSSTAMAPSLLAALPPKLVDRFDLVFVDHRGVGGSMAIDCDRATLAATEGIRGLASDASALDWERLGREYHEACAREAGVEQLASAEYSSASFVADLERVRQTLDIDAWHVLGQSYGTSVAQLYSQAFPDRVRSLILDAPIGRTWASEEMANERAAAASQGLAAIFAACAADSACAADFADGLPATAYAQVAEQLQAAPAPVSLPSSDGEISRRVTIDDLGRVSLVSLADTGNRMAFLRILAAAARGDWVPLARAASIVQGLDPVGHRLWPDALGLRDEAYYAVACADWAETGRDLESLVRSTGASMNDPEGRAAGLRDALCLGWVTDTDKRRSPPNISVQHTRTLIVSGTQDPLAPAPAVEQVRAAFPQAVVVSIVDGSHVSTTRGHPCVDEAVTAFLAGTMASATQCDSELYTPYVPLPPTNRAAYTDPLHVISVAELELLLLPEFQAWAGDDLLTVGCPMAGSAAFKMKDGSIDIALTECEITSDLPLTGTGRLSDDQTNGSFEVTYPGASVTYHRVAESRELTGVAAGKPLELAR